MPTKPSEYEETHIREEELKRRLQRLEEEQRATTESEKRRLKDLHWMHCPKCGQKLALENYGNVEVDLCPACRGLWLDANELDLIVETAGKRAPFHSFLKILRRR